MTRSLLEAGTRSSLVSRALWERSLSNFLLLFGMGLSKDLKADHLRDELITSWLPPPWHTERRGPLYLHCCLEMCAPLFHCLLGAHTLPSGKYSPFSVSEWKSGPHSCICAPIEYWECGPLSTPPPAKGEGPSVLSWHSGRPHPLRTTALTGTHLTAGPCLGRKYTCLSYRITGRFIG